MSNPAERSGSFATQDPVSLLRELSQAAFSGSLRAEHDGLVKVLYLFEGRLACASSTDPRDRLGPLLRDAGQISPEQLELAEDKAVAGEALGSVMVNLGFIGPAGLMWGARRQVEQVVASMLTWETGTFRCRSGSLPERAVNLKLGVPSVVLGGVRLLGDRDHVTSRLGSLDVYLRRPERATYPDAEDHAARGLFDLLDGSRDLRSACAESTLDDFDAAKVALGLQLLGLAERVAGAAAAAGLDATTPLDVRGLAEPSSESGARPASVPAPSAGAPDQHGQPERHEPVDPSSWTDELTDPAPATAGGMSDGESIWEEPLAATSEKEPDISILASAPTYDRPTEPDLAAGGQEDDLPFGDGEDAEGAEGAYDELSMEVAPSSGGGGSSRTLWIGAALVVIAMVVVFAMMGFGDSAPALDTTGGGPSGVLPGGTARAEPVEAEPDAETLAGSDSPAEALGPPQAPPTATTENPSGTVTSAQTADPRPGVETPPGSPTLKAEGGGEAALNAFQNGDYSRAAALWERRVADADPGAYTLQVLVACQDSTLTRLRRSVPASDDLLVVATAVDGKPCYRVGWGVYPSREAAEAGRPLVPAYFTSGGSNPLPVPLSRLGP